MPRRDPLRKIKTKGFILSSIGKLLGRESWLLFRNYFLSGLLILLPSVVTLYILSWIFQFADSGPLGKIVERSIGHRIPGLGLILTIGSVIVSGMIAKNVIGRKAFQTLESVLGTLPVARHVLSSVRQLSDLLITGNKLALERPVLVEYPRLGMYALGFITADAPQGASDVVGEKLFSVYVPTTPNPTSGLVVMVRESQMTEIEFSVDDAMKWIMSAGIIVPDNEKKNSLISPDEGYRLVDKEGKELL